jgi:hypothetical protein
MGMRGVGLALALASVSLLSTAGAPRATAQTPAGGSDALEAAVSSRDVEAIKAMGPGVMPRLARMYALADDPRKREIASVFYQLKWRSPEAKAALMKDAHTVKPSLRLIVQYALGTVSNDVDVVDVLLDNMQNDYSAVFRDKAACALAYDQPHLTPLQKVHLYEGLIRALGDTKGDVRRISALVLQIQTGQDKGFRGEDPPEVRAKAIKAWQEWLAEYRSQL